MIGASSLSPAFAVCEELFAAHPDAVTDEGDSGEVMAITVPGGRLAPAGTCLRLVRRATVHGIYHCLYPVGRDLGDPPVVSLGGRDTWVPEEIARELAAAVVVPVAAGKETLS